MVLLQAQVEDNRMPMLALGNLSLNYFCVLTPLWVQAFILIYSK